VNVSLVAARLPWCRGAVVPWCRGAVLVVSRVALEMHMSEL
jgi:hypothetical protein